MDDKVSLDDESLDGDDSWILDDVDFSPGAFLRKLKADPLGRGLFDDQQKYYGRPHILTLDNDGGSWDELAGPGLAANLANTMPGDRFAMEKDLTLYWPDVRPCWEERSRGGVDRARPARIDDTRW